MVLFIFYSGLLTPVYLIKIKERIQGRLQKAIPESVLWNRYLVVIFTRNFTITT